MYRVELYAEVRRSVYQAAEKLDPYLNVEIEIAVSGLQVAPNRRRHQRNRDLGTSFWCENAFSAACYLTRGKRLVVLVGQKKAAAIAVKNVSGRRRWSKLDEWLVSKATLSA